jgi:CheY-like chemotaxis protein
MKNLDARVLIVDSEEVVRSAFEHIFEYFGCETRSVRNGRMGIEEYCNALCERRPYDLTVLDAAMRVMDVRRTAAKIIRINPHAKLVVSTTTHEDEDVVVN